MKGRKFFVLALVISLVFSLLSVRDLFAGENEKIKQWIDELADSKGRVTAKKHLVQAGPRAESELIGALKDGYLKTSAVISVIQIIKENKFKEAAPVLRELTSSSRARIRLESIRALGAIEAQDSADIFKAALKDANTSIRIAALSSLIEIKDQSAVPDFITSLSDLSAGVRLKAAEALSIFNDRSAIPALLARLNDVNTGVVIQVIEAVSCFKDKEIVAALVTKLDTTNRKIKVKTIKALTRIKDKSVLSLLEPMLKDEFSDVRKVAKVAIESIKE